MTIQKYTVHYEKALDLYLKENKPDAALNILLRLAKANYKKAFGEIGVILYREKNDVKKAESWFKRAEKAGTLVEAATYEYGLLHYLEKNDWETGLHYLFKAAEQGFEVAYGDIGSILYIYKSDIHEAEKWFEKGDKAKALLAPAAYYYGLLLMLERDDRDRSKTFFQKAAEEEFPPAYAEYAYILYNDKKDVDGAEYYFQKSEKEGEELFGPFAHTYGELLINERNEIEKGNSYLEKAKADGYE